MNEGRVNMAINKLATLTIPMKLRGLVLPRTLVGVLLSISLSGCKQGGSSFDFLEVVADGNSPCKITNFEPNTTSVRLPSGASGSRTFTIAPEGTECKIEYRLNGTLLDGETLPSLNLSSALLTEPTNTLEVRLVGPESQATQEWTISRNNPPVCSAQSPAAVGTSLTQGSSQNFTATGSDADGDSLSWTWKINSADAATGTLAVISNTTQSQANFTPTAAYQGTNTLTATMTDGFDTAVCSWTAAVASNCAITSAIPASPSVRVPALSTASTNFTVATTGTGCSVSWTLNGSPIAGGEASKSISSSAFNSGSNSLVATITNGGSTTQQTWTVTKNTPPTCSVSPASSGNSVGVGSPILLTATGADANGDALSFSWTVDGANVGTSILSPSTAATSSVGTFTPTVSYSGNRTVRSIVSDTYDSAECAWSVNVLSNCTVLSSLPNTATKRVSAAPATVTTFGITPNDSACTVSWRVNGMTVSGETEPFFSLPSSSLNTGNNTLEAVISNGVSSATRTWIVSKNSPPVCNTLAQSPASTGNTMTHTQTLVFTAPGQDADGDSISFDWRLDSSAAPLLFSIMTTGNNSSATFDPTISQVGTGRIVSAMMSDGLDSGSCQWSVDIEDPNTVQITSCTPTNNPTVITSSGGASTQTFTANATGTNLTYTWKQDGTVINGASSAGITLAAGALPVGNYSLVAEVRDAYGNLATCNWNVKRNAPPVITNPFPVVIGSAHRMNFESTQPVSVSATDGNGDSLTYTWRLDGAGNASLPSGSTSTTFTPGGSPSMLGARSISVVVSDGFESATQTWNFEVNRFSNACNTIYNGAGGAAGAFAGRICTLIGNPSLGDGLVPSADQTLVKIEPGEVTKDSDGNLYISDWASHGIWVFNRTGAPITRFNVNIPAGTIRFVAGNGAAGVNTEGTTNNDFKFNLPVGVAIDEGSPLFNSILYAADYNNHRVVRIAADGTATRIFGTGATGTSANTDGAVGTSHSCQNPAGLRLMNINGVKNLVIACHGGNVIKRMVADTNNVDYGNGWVLVGALSAGSTVSGAFPGTPGGSGTARVNGPWSVTSDSNGNIYWTEQTGARVRVLNTSGSTLSFFGGLRSPSGNTNMGVTDATGGWNSNLNMQSFISAGTANNLALSVVGQIGVSATAGAYCVPVTVQSRNASNQPFVAAPATSVALSATAGGFFSDSGCTSATASVSLSNVASAVVYYKRSAGTGAVTLTATSAGYTNGTAAVTTSAPSASAPNGIALSFPSTSLYSDCEVGLIQFRNGTTPAPVQTTARAIRLYTNGVGNFYDSLNCTGSPVSEITVNVGQAERMISFQRTAIVGPGVVGDILGSGGNGFSAANGANSIPQFASLGLRNPRGLTVLESSGILGFFIGMQDQHRVVYANNSVANRTFGSVTLEPGDGDRILGDGNGGYLGEGTSTSTRVNETTFTFQLDANTLLIGDRNNNRLRQLNLTTSLTSLFIGDGLLRADFAGDGQGGPRVSLSSPHALFIDKDNRRLYFSDRGNFRLRQVDLATGTVSSVVGDGFNAQPTTENQDPTAIQIRGGSAISIFSAASRNYLLYADQNGGSAANTGCLIRAWNLSGSTGSIFGQSVSSGKVRTLVGSTSLGCQSWGSAPANVDGSIGTSTRLFNPEGFAINAAGDMYIANYDDHCILRVSGQPGTEGQVSRYMGTCGSSTGYPGTNTLAGAVLRYPTSIVMDANYAADGNFFFLDGLDQGSGRVRYVNFRAGFTYGGQSVPAGTPSNPSVITLFQLTNAGQGRLYGLAQFGNQLCYSGGDFGNGNQGPHNVTCRDLSSALGAITLRVGPDEVSTTTRAGGPFGSEQENVAATSSRLYGPVGLSFDAEGNLYITERGNHLIRMVRRWF